MDIVAFGTPFGLAFASGLNAYLPLLAFALSVRWLHLYTVNPQFAFITHTWFIVVLAILTLLDFVADKIPLIDHLWNAIHAVAVRRRLCRTCSLDRCRQPRCRDLRCRVASRITSAVTRRRRRRSV